MSNDGHKKIIIKKIIAEETRKAADRLSHFNHLDLICLKKDLSPEEYVAVYEGVLRNVMKICESLLKSYFSKKERYSEKQKLPRINLILKGGKNGRKK